MGARVAAGITLFLLRAQRALAEVDSSAKPWLVNYNGAKDYLDGPWNVINQTVDFPDQYLAMHPSLTTQSIFLARSACDAQDAACKMPASMWADSDAHTYVEWVNTTIQAASFDSTLEPLNLTGIGINTTDRITLEAEGRDPGYINGAAVVVSENFTSNFPGTYYTLRTSLLSLNAATDTVSWTTSNGTTFTTVPMLYQAYENGSIPSVSYGLQIGSAALDIPGSLILGGYDRGRVISTPLVVSNSQTVNLTSISLGVADGPSAWIGSDNATISNLLANNTQHSSMTVMPNPGVPFMNLPPSVCASIASYLPVYMNAALGLYLWNTTHPAYESIVTSPHYLSLTLSTSSSSTSILIPFILLNLTLENPITASPMKYLPCSPYTPSSSSSSGTYHLGRAFLQAAFLGQNWQTNTLFLAQAPGPNGPTENIKRITANDASLARTPGAPSWYATWASTLTALNESSTSSGSSSSSSSTNSTSGSSLSGGAIAGIVVGVVVAGVAVLAALLFYLVRRRGRANNHPSSSAYAPQATEDSHDGLDAAQGQAQYAALGHGGVREGVFEAPMEEHQIYEVACPPAELKAEGIGGPYGGGLVEMDAGRERSELAGHEAEGGKGMGKTGGYR